MKERGEVPWRLTIGAKLALAPLPLVPVVWAAITQKPGFEFCYGSVPLVELVWIIVLWGIPNKNSSSSFPQELGNGNPQDDKKDTR